MNGGERGAAPSLRTVALAALACFAVVPSASAQWVVLSDRSSFFARGIPDEAQHWLEEFSKQGLPLNTVAFDPKGGWVVVAGKNGLFGRGVVDESFQKILELVKQGAEVRCVAYAPNGGWAIIADKNLYYARNIPDEAFKQLGEFVKAGAEPKAIAFAPNGGWVVLAGKNGLLARGIPDEAFQKLVELAKAGSELKSIAFAPDGGWVLIADKNLYYARGIPDDAFKKLGELAKQGAELKSVSFVATKSALRLSSDDPATRAEVLRRMAAHKVPGLSIAVIKDGRVEWARGYGVLKAGSDAPVTEHTLFQAASISKPVTALAAMRLVQDGKLALDQDISKKLVSWKIPENQFTKREKVTLRRILSHTAGFTVHGFPGYPVGAPVPTLKQVLDGVPPANSPPIRVELLPGSEVQYSGGGYTVLQQLMLDVTGKPFPTTMRTLVLDPAGMKDSTFEQPLPEKRAGDAATAHVNGTPLPGGWHVYPELAAAGLWTTPTDLARFAIAIQKAKQGSPKPILRSSLANEMLHHQKESAGLGLFLAGQGKSEWFFHDGGNAGFECLLRASAEGSQGVVMMTNAAGGLELIAELFESLRAEYRWPSF